MAADFRANKVRQQTAVAPCNTAVIGCRSHRLVDFDGGAGLVVPVDPIREVVLYHGDDETVLYEDVDFSVDYDNQQLVFPIVNIDKKSSILSNNDIVTVVYTPNIEDAGISIGYHVKRSDLSHNIKIKPNFIEYK